MSWKNGGQSRQGEGWTDALAESLCRSTGFLELDCKTTVTTWLQ